MRTIFKKQNLVSWKLSAHGVLFLLIVIYRCRKKEGEKRGEKQNEKHRTFEKENYWTNGCVLSNRESFRKRKKKKKKNTNENLIRFLNGSARKIRYRLKRRTRWKDRSNSSKKKERKEKKITRKFGKSFSRSCPPTFKRASFYRVYAFANRDNAFCERLNRGWPTYPVVIVVDWRVQLAV